MTINIRNQLLKELNLVEHRPEPRKHKQFRIKPKVIIPSQDKTPMMLYIEEKYGKSITEILQLGSLTVIAKYLNSEVDRSTISRWIKRFKLRYTRDNLPTCTNCGSHQPNCDLGVCHILIKSELWDLVLLKREEINDGKE